MFLYKIWINWTCPKLNCCFLWVDFALTSPLNFFWFEFKSIWKNGQLHNFLQSCEIAWQHFRVIYMLNTKCEQKKTPARAIHNGQTFQASNNDIEKWSRKKWFSREIISKLAQVNFAVFCRARLLWSIFFLNKFLLFVKTRTGLCQEGGIRIEEKKNGARHFCLSLSP